ncbi:MAG: hypothetical protein HQ567_22185 [Candidatus Nealsonbacteria bacterium]|nr:hypothetical protein [Candidatus Nealsonbacteria bacterium]
MPKFKIPVSFTVDATVTVEAATYEEACAAAVEADLPPKSEWEYLDDSFHVREDDYEVQDAETGVWMSHLG